MKNALTTNQLEIVLGDVCQGAMQLDKLGQMLVDLTSELHCPQGTDGVPRELAADVSERMESLALAVRFTAQRVGWMADMAMPGGPDVMGGATDWMLPNAFHGHAKGGSNG